MNVKTVVTRSASTGRTTVTVTVSDDRRTSRYAMLTHGAPCDEVARQCHKQALLNIVRIDP